MSLRKSSVQQFTNVTELSSLSNCLCLCINFLIGITSTFVKSFPSSFTARLTRSDPHFRSCYLRVILSFFVLSQISLRVCVTLFHCDDDSSDIDHKWNSKFVIIMYIPLYPIWSIRFTVSWGFLHWSHGRCILLSFLFFISENIQFLFRIRSSPKVLHTVFFIQWISKHVCIVGMISDALSPNLSPVSKRISWYSCFFCRICFCSCI